MKRFDICVPRPRKDGKTYWHKIGAAFEGEKGIGLVFDSLPLPNEKGEVRANLFEAKPKAQADVPDDEVPF